MSFVVVDSGKGNCVDNTNKEKPRKIFFIFFVKIFGCVNTVPIPLGMEKEKKRIRRTEYIQVRMTEQGKDFIKAHFGDQSEFVRSAIVKAAKEKGVPVPAL